MRRSPGAGLTLLHHADDTILLGDDTIHGVSKPRDQLTGAIHICGGDFVNQPRSQWGPGPIEERPFQIEDARRQLAEANASWKAGRTNPTPP